MTVKEAADLLQCEILTCQGLAGEREVKGGYCGDLLSWVMGRAHSGDAWITVMGNVNAIAVAVLADTACILLAENAVLDQPAREKAEQQEVVILQSSRPAYTLAAELDRLCLCDGA